MFSMFSIFSNIHRSLKIIHKALIGVNQENIEKALYSIETFLNFHQSIIFSIILKNHQLLLFL